MFQAGPILLDALKNALKVSTAIIAAKSDFQAPHIGGEKKIEEVQDRLAIVTIDASRERLLKQEVRSVLQQGRADAGGELLKEGRLSEEATARIMKEVLTCVAYLHEQNVLHG